MCVQAEKQPTLPLLYLAYRDSANQARKSPETRGTEAPPTDQEHWAGPTSTSFPSSASIPLANQGSEGGKRANKLPHYHIHNNNTPLASDTTTEHSSHHLTNSSLIPEDPEATEVELKTFVEHLFFFVGVETRSPEATEYTSAWLMGSSSNFNT